VFLIRRGKSMPPKQKFTKEEMINAAIELIRRDGRAALTARKLGLDELPNSAPNFNPNNHQREKFYYVNAILK
jgi:hypothetical protein